MTIPAMMNCQHSADGWCLDCVKDLDAQLAAANERVRVLEGAVSGMLNIFDRGLPESSIGRRVCDEARVALAGVLLKGCEHARDSFVGNTVSG